MIVSHVSGPICQACSRLHSRRDVDERPHRQDTRPAFVPGTVWGTAPMQNLQVQLGAVLALKSGSQSPDTSSPIPRLLYVQARGRPSVTKLRHHNKRAGTVTPAGHNGMTRAVYARILAAADTIASATSATSYQSGERRAAVIFRRRRRLPVLLISNSTAAAR
jgi:hypothetical protein